MESKRLNPSFAGHSRRLLIAAFLAVAASLIAIVPAMASAHAASTDRLQTGASNHSSAAAKPGTLNSAARYAKKHGYLPLHPARYARQKARANRQAKATQALASPASGGLLAPTKIRTWAGINDVNSAPPDETSAVGTGRYIELVNSKFAIYNKTANTPLSTGSINGMV